MSFVDRLADSISDLRYRLRAIVRRSAMERELAEELSFHLDREAEKYARQGATPHEAARRARLAFGGIERFKEESRDVRGVSPLEVIAQDLRFAARGLRLRPGFAIAVALTLGLGIGANAAMFDVIDRLLFRSPPYLRDPATVHRVYLLQTTDGREQPEAGFEYTRYMDLGRWTTAFSQTTAFGGRLLAIGDGEEVEEMPVAMVTASYFAFFDAPPAIGRYFTAREDTVPVGAPVAVISYAFWQARYGGRSDVLGTPLRVGPLLTTVIGVAPKHFAGFEDSPPVVFIPATTYAGSIAQRANVGAYDIDYGWRWLQMIARRRPGVTIAAASADLSNAYRRSYAAQRALGDRLTPPEVARPRAIAAPLSVWRGPSPGRVTRIATWTAGVAVIVLLIACANVANLQLHRSLARRREIGVRLALGASGGRLAAQLLTESVLLAVLGCAVGLALAQWGGAVLGALFLPEGTSSSTFGAPRTLAFAAVIALLAGTLTGLAPAFHARRLDLVASLKAGARAGAYQRSGVRTLLLVFQGVLSVALLVGAGLFMRSLHNVRSLRLGYDVDRVLYVYPNLRGLQLPRAQQIELARRLRESAEAMPEVARAALGASVPFWSTWGQRFSVPGIDSVQRLGRFTVQAASGGYFETMGTRIIRGRPITDADDRRAPPVAVVSDGMARAVWPGRDAIGQCIEVRTGPDARPCTLVVGIAENIKQNGLGDDQQLQFYLAIEHARTAPGVGLFVRTRGDATRATDAVRRRLQPLMPGAGYVVVTPVREIVDPTMRSWRLGATMFLAFGGLALVVAAVGLYGVVAYNVAQRTRDIGVRVALGATGGDVVRLVVGEGVRFAAAGVGGGLLVALAAGPWLAPLLFATSPKDPLVFAAVASVLLIVAVVASAVPAWRAAGVDPNVALRTE